MGRGEGVIMAGIDIQMFSLDSSNLVAAGFDPDNGIMVIEFKGGKQYRWDGIPQPVYDGLMSADSPGKYYYQAIERVFGVGTKL